MKLYHVFIYISLFFIEPLGLFAQSFPGLAHDKNTISDIYYNPAMALNDDAFQVNVAGFSFLAGNNGYGIKKSELGSTPQNGVNYFKLPGTFTRSAWINMDILGPAVTFKIKKKYSFAISTRTRFMANVDNINNDIFKLIDSKSVDTGFIYKINNFALTSQMFAEVNLMYSGYIYQSEDFNLQGGVALKILSGIGAVGVGVPHAQFQMGPDNIPRHMSGSINIDFTPYANTWLSSGKPFNATDNVANNRGYGLDIGAVYYYTPTTGVHTNHDGYIFRVAASITDIGHINYTASSTTGSYVGNSDTFNQNTIDKNPATTYGQILNKYVTDSTIKQTASKTKFKMGLPTAMHINADAKMGDNVGFKSYLNINLLLNLRKPSSSDFSTHYTSTCVIAPRFLWKNYGFGVPFSFNANKQGFLGIILYAGPFYLGTGSLANYFILNNITSADAFIGMSFRIPGKKTELY